MTRKSRQKMRLFFFKISKFQTSNLVDFEELNSKCDLCFCDTPLRGLQSAIFRVQAPPPPKKWGILAFKVLSG